MIAKLKCFLKGHLWLVVFEPTHIKGLFACEGRECARCGAMQEWVEQ